MKHMKQQRTQEEKENVGLDDVRWQLMVPGAFVRPPISRFPPSPSFLYAFLKAKSFDLVGRIATVITSKPTFLTSAKFKQNNSQLVPTAKALHRAMYEAVARGDKLALKKVCGEHLASRFAKAIDARPAGRRYGWELVKYNSTMFWPRVLDNKIIQMGADKKMGVTRPPVIRQVVVGIQSRQRRWEVENVKGKDRVVEGSEKEQDVTEYVVLNCAMDRDTWTQGDWRIIGTTSETTPEKWKETQRLLQDIESLS